MFRTLIYPSSGAGDYSVELPHWSYCSWFDVCWSFGVVGLEWCIRVAGLSLQHGYNYNFSVNKNPTDASVRRYLFTAKSLYVFRVSQHPSSGAIKTVTAVSGTGHNTGTATSLQRGLIRTRRR